ncbi:MAG: hypothetical protein V1834_04350 [Candidatus Micrarchaeota archaeon]
MILQDINSILEMAILAMSPITAAFAFLLLRYENKTRPGHRHAFPIMVFFVSIAVFFGVIASSFKIDFYFFAKNVVVLFILAASFVLLHERIHNELDPSIGLFDWDKQNAKRGRKKKR